jgi:general secretion pathway protein A
MSNAYRNFFAFTREPFAAELRPEELLKTPATVKVCERVLYAVRNRGVAVVTGEVGSGKSTALRLALAGLHPSEYKILVITATPGGIGELYKQIAWGLDLEAVGSGRARSLRLIRNTVCDLVESRKLQPLVVVDEANHLTAPVLSELHVITQHPKSGEPLLPFILAGQTGLLDKLSLRCVASLASRVIAKSHLEAVSLSDMAAYLQHHLQLAGGNHGLFSEPAQLAVFQSSGGFYRKANHLARGALIAAAAEKCQIVSPDHVRQAATELM